jgi:hypothetical protein
LQFQKGELKATMNLLEELDRQAGHSVNTSSSNYAVIASEDHPAFPRHGKYKYHQTLLLWHRMLNLIE